jgi:hypothetical protein
MKYRIGKTEMSYLECSSEFQAFFRRFRARERVIGELTLQIEQLAGTLSLDSPITPTSGRRRTVKSEPGVMVITAKLGKTSTEQRKQYEQPFV